MNNQLLQLTNDNGVQLKKLCDVKVLDDADYGKAVSVCNSLYFTDGSSLFKGKFQDYNSIEGFEAVLIKKFSTKQLRLFCIADILHV